MRDALRQKIIAVCDKKILAKGETGITSECCSSKPSRNLVGGYIAIVATGGTF